MNAYILVVMLLTSHTGSFNTYYTDRRGIIEMQETSSRVSCEQIANSIKEKIPDAIVLCEPK